MYSWISLSPKKIQKSSLFFAICLLQAYKGLKHEMLNEVKEEADKVMSDIVEWLRKRIES